MKSFCKTLLILFVLLAFGQCTWAQTQYINQLRLVGDYDELIGPDIELNQDDGWSLIDYNLNEGTNSDQIIYLLYKTGLADDYDYAPITDFYIKSTSEKNDHPDEVSYNNRTYHRISSYIGSSSFESSYGDLNDGAGGRYIYLYYTTDEWDYPRGITSIAFNDNSNGAVCGNGSTTPQDLNEGAGGDYVYMHYGYTLTTTVINVYDTPNFSPLNAHSDQPLYFRLADDAVNGYVVTSSTVNVGHNNIAIVDLNGKPLDRLIQSGSCADEGHVFKVFDNSKLIIIDSSIEGTGSISSGNANQGGAFYVDASSELIIEGGTIEYCQAEYGGAIYNLGTLTINGGTIQNCTATRGWGQGIIYNNGTLTINNGTIQNNTAYDGGAIYNFTDWTTTINGGTIQNNSATGDGYNIAGIGGGIANNGTLIINGGNIIGNTSASNGGGIYGSINGSGGIFIKNNPVIRDNKMGSDANNVYIPDGKVINVTGNFTEGACIGLTPQTADNIMTNHYSTYNNGVDPARIFLSDNGHFIKLNASNEVIQDPSLSVVEAKYIDAESNEAYYSNCFPLSSVKDEYGVTLNSGWYVVDAYKTFNQRIHLNGNINIILKDGCELTVNQGIEIGSDDYSLTIYGQSGQSGYFVANNEVGDNNCYGTITINGGIVNIHSYISAKSINLNWTDYSITTTERITVVGNYYGTVTLQKAFYNGTNVIPAGVVTNNNILNTKTLVPYALYNVNFTVVNGSFTASPNPVHNGTTVTLTGTPADEAHPLCSEITVTGVNTGGDVPVTRVGSSNNFTFVMPNEAVNVNAKFEDKILADYVNLFGETKSVPATVISGGGNLTLSNGWYVVSNDINSSTGLKNITVNGNNVNLILCDFRTLDLDDENDSYVTFTENSQLFVWGQSANTGLLKVANTSGSIPIGHATLTCRIVINGGGVHTFESDGNIGGTNAIITLRGGIIIANGYEGKVRFKRFYNDPYGTVYFGEKTSDLSALNYKYLTPCDKVFVKEGNWNVPGNWFNGEAPGSNDYVTLLKRVSIPNGCLAQVKDIMLAIGSGITIKDGGQFFVATDRSLDLQVTVEKNISAADGEAQTNWYLLSSPVYNNLFTSPYNYYAAYTNTVKNLTKSAYDMFRYSESNYKWQNKKAHGAAGFQVMERGRGFLYRNAENQTIIFTGTMSYGPLASNNYQLSYTELSGDHAALKGFNLIGNPYTHDIKKGEGADISIPNDYLETGFYKLSNNGQWTACTDDATIINACEAILVQAKSTANGQCLGFVDNLPSSAKTRDNNDNIMFTVANSLYSDVAYVMFEEGHGLTKIDHRNAEIPMLYIPKNDEHFAIATMSAATTMFTLNFKAKTMGSYTISCNPEGDFNYLHLIDRFTGEDVDMLLEGEYTFMASPTDNLERFIVKLEYSDGSEISEVFAYQNGNEIIVNGEGTLQVFDVMGRMVMTQNVNGVETFPETSLSTGVYILKLNEKTQKIVVR